MGRVTSEHPPSVDTVARSLVDIDLPQPLLVDAARTAIAEGDASLAQAYAEAMAGRLLRPVVNATGVLLHTNLGRAPVARTASDGRRYTNLELDSDTGGRGSRQDRVGPLLARACGTEAAMVVNNGAASVLLALAALAGGGSVAVSRGELVEIGGGFRLPEVMSISGARLVEVGTTNRTRLDDYAAVADGVAVLLKVHTSNYRVTGFTEDVSVPALATVGPPVVVDVGSGLLDAATPWLATGPPSWLRDEPAVCQTVEAGADLVTFSGDKLLGGPQAGILAGRADLVAACAAHPLARALRPGGLVLDVLQETVLAYLRRDGDAIPLWRMAVRTVDQLRARAAALDVGEVVACASVTGGGTLPGVELPSAGVAVAGDHAVALRAADPPIVARVHEDVTICDLRTVDPVDDPHVAAALRALP